jgi:NAD(P)-dependent dehydrogenase (short-subunit alcohol dehydrogenase family)
VVGINPGPVATDRLKSLFRQRAEAKFGDPERYPELFTGMSFGRPATPEEIAWMAAFLASERSGYTSGCIVTIDGGLAARST